MATIVKSLKASQFATSFVLRPKQFAWLLGAGASASAGIPTGNMMIRDFKTRLFCQQSGLPRREVDSTDPLWIQRVEEFLKKRSNLPSSGDPSEYSAAFEAVFPEEAERRLYVEEAIRKGTPSFGHRVLASLITTKRIPCIFTTNFDPLIESASTQTDSLVDAGDRAMPTVAALDSAERAERCLRESSWPLIAKIHGDYQSIKLKNTAAELQQQDEKMRRVLTGACQRFGLIVVGYSGRDVSVMEALEDALKLDGAYPGGIYWVVKSERDLPSAVQKFLKKAVEAGVGAFLVTSQNFDEFAADVLSQFTLPTALHKHVFELRPAQILRPAPLPSGDASKFPVLRCSALLVNSLPRIARRITLSIPASTPKVRELLRAANVYAVVASTGNEVAAFGNDREIVGALAPLGAKVAGTVPLDPEHDSWALGLLYDALTRALCRRRPLVSRLRRSGHSVFVAKGKQGEDEQRTTERKKRLAHLATAYEVPLSGNVPTLGFPYSEGVRLRLERSANRWWCVFDPATFIDFPIKEASQTDGGGAEAHVYKGDPAGDWRRERWAQKYNAAWTKIINAWASLLAGTEEDGIVRAYGTAEIDGIDAVFGLSEVTAWSRPSHEHSYFERRR